jgi:hypothetical protein
MGMKSYVLNHSWPWLFFFGVLACLAIFAMIFIYGAVVLWALNQFGWFTPWSDGRALAAGIIVGAISAALGGFSLKWRG